MRKKKSLAVAASPKSLGNLRLILGERNYRIELNSIKIRGLSDNIAGVIKYTPATNDLNLELLSPTRLFITPSSNENSNDWLRGDLEVEHVQFSQIKQNAENITDVEKMSSIEEGKVRIQGQILELQSEQFLIFPRDSLGIQRIRSIHLEATTSPAVHFTFRGQALQIGAGLYPEFPVQEIKPNFFSKFPPEVITLLFSLLGALAAVLLPNLFEGSKPPP
jgi:hypothetical protein